MSILKVKNLRHQFGDKLLYRGESFTVERGEHIGVTGQNGAGKSTLFSMLKGELAPDEGEIRFQKGVRLACLDQHDRVKGGTTVREHLLSAFSHLLEMEQRMEELYMESAVNGDEACLKRAASIQEELLAEDYYSIDSQVERVAAGLGLMSLGLARKMETLSGGQRGKVILGKLLLQKADLVLLDEPTNFLDQEHIAWLGQWLAAEKGAFLVISHDARFLSQVSAAILDIELGSIRKYHGTYSHFLKQKEHLRTDYQNRYEAEQREIKRTEEYIRKNIAGVNTRIAKGRRTRLARMERMEAPGFAVKPTFRFADVQGSPGIILESSGLEVGYEKPVLPPVALKIKGGEKWAVTGFNGVGKTTLLNTLTGSLRILGGKLEMHPQVKIAYYDQELRWEDEGRTALQIVMDKSAQISRQEARRALSQCGIRAELAEQPIGKLSGGEQSKVKLCLLLMEDYDMLVLDEPTNHMDQETKAVLKEALKDFTGTVLLVSHEPAFYQDWVDGVLEL